MDGQGMTTHQELVDEGAELLAQIESDMLKLTMVMNKAGRQPFAEKKCNRRFARAKQRWARLSVDVEDFHADLTDCVRDGAPETQFGGDK